MTAERLLAKGTSRLIALGPLQRDDLLSRGIGRPDQFEIVPLGLDLDPYRSPDRAAARNLLGLPADAIVIVSVGRLVPIKRVDRLIRVFASVHARRPDVRLYLIGDGSERIPAEAQVARGRPTGCGDILWVADGHGGLVRGCGLRCPVVRQRGHARWH